MKDVTVTIETSYVPDSGGGGQEAVDIEAAKYMSTATISKNINPQTDVTKQIVRLIDGQVRDTDVTVSYAVKANDFIKVKSNKLMMQKKNTNKETETVVVILTFEKDGKQAKKDVTVTIEAINKK